MHMEFLTIAKLVLAYRSGQLSPVEVTRHLLERIERHNPDLHAFVTIDRERALRAARRAEQSYRRGQVHGRLLGVPIAHKDIYLTRGLRTTANSPGLLDFVPAEDATVVARMARAGAITLGKASTYEHACGTPDLLGFPVNPYNLAHITGGSSAGSAGALAAGLVFGATGSDTGGSIRGPAAFCGITGLKPTFGRVSRHGVLPLSGTLDHAGPMGRTVEDVELLLRSMSGYDPRDPATRRAPAPSFDPAAPPDLAGLRIGVASNLLDLPSLDPEMRSATDSAARTLAELGANVEELALPLLDEAEHAGVIILHAESYAVHAERLEARPEQYGTLTRERLARGKEIPASEYLRCLGLKQEFTRSLEQTFEQFDLILSPAMPGPAPAVADFTKYVKTVGPYTRPGNVCGAPCLTLPCGFTQAGLPLGMQLMSRWWNEAQLLRAGHAYQQATAWHTVRPTGFAG